MALKRTEGCPLSYSSSLECTGGESEELRKQELGRARAYTNRKLPNRRRYSGHILRLMAKSKNLGQKIRIV